MQLWVGRMMLFCLLMLGVVPAAAQRFFNLTADEVRIDSMLPRFSYAFPVGEHYADSVYEVEIKYPEFIDMSKTDLQRYRRITDASLPELPEVEHRLVVERKRGKLEVSFVPLVKRNGREQLLVSFMLDVKAKPAKRSVRKANMQKAAAASSRYASHSVLATGKWAKIRIPETGVYQLTSALLQQAGFSNPDRVKVYGYGGRLQNEELVGEELAALDDLQEVPTCTVNGRRLFYGYGPVSWSDAQASRRIRNPYSTHGYYLLTESEGEPLRVDSAAFVGGFYPSPDDYHTLHEVDNFAWFNGGRNLCENSPVALGASKDYVLANDTKSTKGQLSVCITSGEASTVAILLNGKDVGTVSTTIGRYEQGAEAALTVDVDGLSASNTVTIKTTAGGPVRLDYISLAYEQPRSEPRLSAGTFPQPEYLYGIMNQDRHADGPADLVIIIPTSQHLLTQAQRLADFHASHDGLRVNIVPADELYNEFSSGTPDANAYRRYMKMLYDRAADEKDLPKSLLLFGDCVWDNRMLTADCSGFDPDHFLLAFESENSFSETHCYVDDGFFGLLDDGEGLNPMQQDKLDIGVGRFPVVSEYDAKTMVDKVIAYETNANAGDWQNIIMFMGDDGNENLHMRDVNQTAETISDLYPGYMIKKVMWDAYTRETSSTGNSYPEVVRLVKQQQQAGALIMDYAGHGRADMISHEGVLHSSDFRGFVNANLPLWVTASCDIMPFDSPRETIGEVALLNRRGGAVAFYGTTRTVYANENKYLNTAFLKHVLSFDGGKPITLGEAQRRAKNEMITSRQDLSQNKLQYSLLGDPAMALNLPTLQTVVDEINGIPVRSADGTAVDAASMSQLKAGSVVKVKGHIERNGALAKSFQGQMTATVRDTRELIVCKLNDTSEASTAFQFYDRPKVLFNGTDNVQDGVFEFSFSVPLDINYEDGTGLMNIHAVNEDHTLAAHGAEDGFYINGSEAVQNDQIGPSVYCYLNTPSFTDGGNVNSTPYFVANITDKDGINATGNGIGHDLELIIDGEMAKTYNLNCNFSYDFGTYTSGSTYYYIPELEPGAHQLKFRAWDILNNSSTTVLNFNVVKGLQPDIVDISCTNNPATTNTTFIVTHNFTGADVNVELSIFDMSGRELWRHEESGASVGSTFTVDWNLTVDGGARLQTGVYLYRVRLSSDGSSKASKAKKLVVIDR